MAPVSALFLLCLMALSVLSNNCNGLRDPQKRSGFLQWLHGLPCTVDVVCVQVAHCVSSAECESWFRSSGLSSVVSPGSNKSCGCVVLFRPALSFVESWSDSDGRFLQCEFQFRDKSFRVVSLYAPNCNPARDQFFDLVSSFVDSSISTVLCIPSLMVRWTVRALLSLTILVIARLRLFSSLRSVVSLMSGATCIPPPLVLRGSCVMAFVVTY